MKTIHLKIQFYYGISIFTEKNENFFLQYKFTQTNTTSKTFSMLDFSIQCTALILILERIFQSETKSGKIGHGEGVLSGCLQVLF